MNQRRPSLPSRIAALGFVAMAWGCSEPRGISLEITLGQETDALDDVEVVRIRAVSATGEGTAEANTIAEVTTTPGGTFDLGDLTTEDIVWFDVFGEDADGTEIVRGRSVTIPIGSVASEVIPVFAQEKGSFARPPGELVRAHVHAPAAVIDEQFLLAFGGDAAATDSGAADPAFGDFYDLLSLSGGETADLPRVARSLVARSSILVLIDDDGATALDRNDQTSELAPPDGFTFGEVAGGRTVEASDGSSFVVGCTRPDAPTDAVLTIDGSGGLGVVRLASPRAGCGATFVDGLGLVVHGGTDEGKALEVVALGGEASQPLAYDADGTSGAALVVTGEDLVLAIGGEDGAGVPATPRFFDLRCQASCEPDELPAATLDALASRGEGFRSASGVLVVGESPDGETLAFRVELPDGGVTALPFRERRFGATPVPAPNGTLAVLGGLKPSGRAARTVELFFPD